MADIKQIQFKRSVTAGKKPAAADLVEGELAINLTDRTIFTKDRQGQVVDLGFAKGGRVDGDITQVGSYTQTGNFNQTGNFTTTGDVSAKTLLVSSGVESQGDIRSNSGVLRTRANATSNAHLWFEGIEVGTGKNFERGVMYAPPQQANAGAINLRVLNGTATDAGQALFSWLGNGDFNIPRDFLGQRARLAIEVVAPTMNASRLYTATRQWEQFGPQSYGWDDLVSWTPAENGPLAVNYVYKGRAKNAGMIWHQLLDERDVAEWAIYTGTGPEKKTFSIRSSGSLGHGKFTGSLMVGGATTDYSTLGVNSLTIGENNTGLRNTSTGNLDIISSGGMQFRMSATGGNNISYKRLLIQHSDANGNAVLPAGNNAQLQIDTSGDDNNTGGNGLTLIGYYTTGGEYYHYFRGKGEAAFSMGKGVRIDQGGLTVNGNSTFTNALNVSGTVTSSRFDALGDLAFKNTGPRHIRWEYTNSGGATTVDGYIFKDGPSSTNRRPGIRINCSAPNSSTTSGDFVFNEDGNLTVPVQVQPGNYSNFDSRYQNLFQLGANVNLDTLTADSQLGEYAQHASANASLALNYPEALAGHLTITGGGGVQQRYHVYNSTRVYLRAKYSSEAWKPWDRVVTDDYLSSGIADSIVSKAANAFRAAYGTYGFFIRNDGNNTYFMLTNANDAMGNYNGLRPITIANSTGSVSIGTGLTTNTLNVISGNITWGSAGAAVANDGNIKGTRWASFGNSTWAGDALAWVNTQNVAKAGDTMTGKLVLQNTSGDMVRMNCTEGGAVYLLGQRNGANGFYVGLPSSGNNAVFHSYLNGTTLELRPSDIYFSKTVYGNGDANFNNVYIRSDITLKRNFKTIENALDKVDKLEGLIYEKKNSHESTEYETTEAGIIAQSLQAVLPEAVAEHEGVLNVSASGTIALLVNAIKELKARVEYLESK